MEERRTARAQRTQRKRRKMSEDEDGKSRGWLSSRVSGV